MMLVLVMGKILSATLSPRNRFYAIRLKKLEVAGAAATFLAPMRGYSADSCANSQGGPLRAFFRALCRLPDSSIFI